jgi:hypothetical protein
VVLVEPMMAAEQVRARQRGAAAQLRLVLQVVAGKPRLRVQARVER